MKKTTGISLIAALAMALLLAQCQNNSNVNSVASNATSSSTTELDTIWVNESYGYPPISLETPYPLISTSLPVPESARTMIDQMSVFKYGGSPKVKIMVNSATYAASIKVSIEGAADGAMQQLKNTSSISSVEYNQKEIRIGKKKSIVQTGTYYERGKKIDFENLIVMEKQNFWNVLVWYEYGYPEGQKIKERVFKSIKI